MNKLADLLKKAGLEASEASEAPEAPPVDAAAPVEEPIAYAPKVVVRRSRKGYGGKTVTVVSGVTSGMAQLTKQLGKQLGVGTRVQEGELVLHGDQVERVARWLESQGVNKVVRAR